MSNASSHLPVAVIGAGPVGLAAAAHLVERGIPFIVLEQGAEVGAAIRQWGHVRTFSPWRYNIDLAARRLLEAADWISPDLEELPTGNQIIDQYLTPLAELPTIRPHLILNASVLHVGRRDFDKVKTVGREERPFLIALADGRMVEAASVIDASGTWFSPNPMGAGGYSVPGEHANSDRIVYGIPDVLNSDREHYAGRRTLVLGSGHSAINTMLDLLVLQESATETRVAWGVRRADISSIFGGEDADALPARGALGKRARAAIESGRVEFIPGLRVTQVATNGDGLTVHATVNGQVKEVDVDRIVVAAGFRPNLEMHREIRLRTDPWLEAAEQLAPLIDPNVHNCGTVRSHGARELAHPESNFFIVGMKSYGRAPTFLMATGHEQVRSVVAMLAGDIAAAERVELELPETGVCSSATSGAACCGTAGPQAALAKSGLSLTQTGKDGVVADILAQAQVEAAETEDASGCCGGPASTGVDACCVKDADAKASGESGCGCVSTPAPQAETEPKAAACCG